MAQFQIRYYRSFGLSKDYVVIGECDTLAAARDLRRVSGDVVTNKYGELVRDVDWLWDWELVDPKSFARTLIEG